MKLVVGTWDLVLTEYLQDGTNVTPGTGTIVITPTDWTLNATDNSKTTVSGFALWTGQAAGTWQTTNNTVTPP